MPDTVKLPNPDVLDKEGDARVRVLVIVRISEALLVAVRREMVEDADQVSVFDAVWSALLFDSDSVMVALFELLSDSDKLAVNECVGLGINVPDREYSLVSDFVAEEDKVDEVETVFVEDQATLIVAEAFSEKVDVRVTTDLENSGVKLTVAVGPDRVTDEVIALVLLTVKLTLSEVVIVLRVRDPSTLYVALKETVRCLLSDAVIPTVAEYELDQVTVADAVKSLLSEIEGIPVLVSDHEGVLMFLDCDIVAAAVCDSVS